MTRLLCLVAVLAVATFAVADDAKEWKELAATYTMEKVEIGGSDQTTAFKEASLVISFSSMESCLLTRSLTLPKISSCVKVTPLLLLYLLVRK